MNRPLAITHLCAPAHVGGLETVVQGLAEGQRRRGHRVRVLAVVEPEADPSAFLDPLRTSGVEVECLTLGARAYLSEVRRVRELLRTWDADILHTHGYRSDLLHGWSARQMGIATVTTLHGFSMRGGRSSLFEHVQRRVVGRFDAVVAVSAPIADTLVNLGIPRDRVHVVPNAWKPPRDPLARPDARRELGVGDDEALIGWVGRLFPIKGCDVFLRALAATASEGWVAHIVGDGPEREPLETLAEQLGLGDRVRFAGAIPDAARLFSALDLYVLSSRSEGTPMVLLEAMGAGVPIVATAVGGVPDVIAPPHQGWLVPPEDPGALAEAIDSALTDDARRATVSAAGRARVRTEFAREAWVERHDEVYNSALRVSAGR